MESDDDTLSVALRSGGWGMLSAISLVIGALIGILRNPPKAIRAVLMAYGSGALIEALSIELFAHIVHMANAVPVLSCDGTGGNSTAHRRLAGGDGKGPGKKLVYLAMFMGLVGGCVFAGMNKLLNDAGGWARKASTLKNQLGKRRLMFYTGLASKLEQVPMFKECLDATDLHNLSSKMCKDTFEEGEVLFHDAEVCSPVYFLLSGEVRVDVFRTSGTNPEVIQEEVSDYCSESIPENEEAPKPKDELRLAACAPHHSESQQDKQDYVVDSYIVRKHQLFGELALFTGQPIGTQAVAVTQCSALKLTTHDFMDVCIMNQKLKSYLEKAAALGLSHTPLFGGNFKAESIEHLLSAMTLSSFSAEEELFDESTETTPIYYLVLGKIEVTYAPIGILPAERRLVRPTSFFGEDHLANGRDVQVSAVALDRSLAVRIDRDKIETLIAENPGLQAAMQKVTERAATMTPLMATEAAFFRNEEGVHDWAPAGSFDPDAMQNYLGWEELMTGLHPDLLKAAMGPRAGNGRLSVMCEERGRRVKFAPQSHLDAPRRASIQAAACPPLGDGHDSFPKESVGISVRNRCSKTFPEDSNGDGVHPFETSMGACGESRSDKKRASVSIVDLPDENYGRQTTHCGVSDGEIFEEMMHQPQGNDAHGQHEELNSHAAIMIWLGILIDACPESIVLGILASTSTTSSLITFVIGVFLSNLPEAMSSSATMFACGIPRKRIMLMWSSIVVLTGFGASFGAMIFHGKHESEDAQMAIAAIEGMCGGAMLAMIANTALPEAFEQGGDVVGLSTLSGFLSALFVGVVSS